jgi:hypothetical protein
MILVVDWRRSNCFIFCLKNEMNSKPIEIYKLISKINTKMKKLCEQSKFIEPDKVAPIHPDYPVSNVGLMLLAARSYLLKQTMY